MSLLPTSPDVLRLVAEDLDVNSLTINQAAGSVGLRFTNAASSTGSNRRVITGATTLTAADSGSICVWNAATGYTFTLPAAAVGLTFDFFVSVTNTATADKIITGSASHFLVGGVLTGVVATTPAANPGPKFFSFDGTTHVACTMGGTDTTAGGVAGTFVRVFGLSTTVWGITGNVIGAGTIVTPAATS